MKPRVVWSRGTQEWVLIDESEQTPLAIDPSFMYDTRLEPLLRDLDSRPFTPRVVGRIVARVSAAEAKDSLAEVFTRWMRLAT